MFVNDFVLEIFSAFKSLKLKASINSPSLCLHVRRVMTALENAVFSLSDAKVFIEYLMNLGERHSMAREAGKFRCMYSVMPIKVT